MSNQTPYLGSKISLISKLDIRYEGILYTVDTNDSTIALAKVRSFGTEDRPTQNPVAARDEVYEYIIFKASDIKDLIVCETPKVPTHGGLPYDPAIVSVSSRTAPSNEQQSAGSSRPTTPKRQSPLNNRAPGAGRNQVQRGRGGFQQQVRDGGHFQERRNYNNYQGGRGGPPFRGGYVNRGGPRNAAPKEKLKFDSDYDFEKANEQFADTLSDMLKEKLTVKEHEEEEPEKETSEEETATNEDNFYDKKTSFFDRISCEALEKAEGRNGRPDWKKERETNQETFGHSAVRSLNYRRGFGRGGRGQRFNGNSGGYGYNNYNNRNYNNGYGYNNRGGGYRRNFNNQQQPAQAEQQ